MRSSDILKTIEAELEKIIDIEDINQRLEAFKSIIDLYIDLELVGFFSSLLSNYREFNFQDFIDASLTVRDFIDVTVTSNSVNVDLNKIELRNKLRSDFEKWKRAILDFRDLLGVSYKTPLKNSHFVRILFERGDEYYVTFPKLLLSGKSLGFLWVILNGNMNVDWGDVEYGGFSPVKYSGTDFILDLEVALKERLTNTIVRDLQRVLSDYILVVNKTKFINDILRSSDRAIVEVLNKAASYIIQGKPLSGLLIEINGVIYELIRTKSGRLGARYSLKYNRRSRNWEIKRQ